MTEPRAVVLDFDGVVLESLDIKTRAFVELFADHPQHRDAIVRLHLDNAGMSRFEKFRRIHAELLRAPLDEAEERRLGDRFSELVFEQVLACPFVRGAREFLDWAAQRYPLYVASGTPEEELLEIVERRGIAGCFEAVHGTPRTKPELLRAICDEGAFAPAELVFVGDASTDHAAAHEVGVPFVGRCPAGCEPAFPVEGAVLVVEDLAELRQRWHELLAAVAGDAAAAAG